MNYNLLKKQIKAVSFSFFSTPVEEVFDLVSNEAKNGCDIIILPETWNGDDITQKLDNGINKRMCEIAKQYNTYIINSMTHVDNQGNKYNSAILINREGAVQGVYNKVYPYWCEFDTNPTVFIGCEVPVFETDFGKIGMAICFDANFPNVWQQLSERGADIVFWPSAYSAGRSLQAHAINHNYYIITSTYCNDCIVYDITGEEVFYKKSDKLQISRLTIDLNREIFHENFNMEKISKLLEENKDVSLEQHLTREQWLVLKSNNEDVSIKELIKEYGIEPLRDYKYRSKTEIDKMRNFQKIL